ncbi:mRNA decay activator protein ZFP36L2-A-like [Uloborus diversus]|uniref:mRNA decay activator protein ZFP36L2-A-like n=1 Tax=Uloborus diversus TaxID=327109 RepID=UPI00240A20DC|nr:mRNA decay activator protein ZFP36L2-A-like [Uloborus diversus]
MTPMCIDRSQSPTHKGSFLQGRKSPVSNNLNQQNANNHRRNSCSPPLSKDTKSSGKLSDPDRRSQSVQSSRYKTELCRPFEESGTCKYGDKCQFAHGVKELRSMARHPKYKTELCRTFHSTGLCPYGPRCHFIHNSEQAKKSLLTNLAGSTVVVTANQPMHRPKALNSLSSTGDISPPSSHGGSPTGDGDKSFDDLYQENNLCSDFSNNALTFSKNLTNLMNSLHQSYVEYPNCEYNSDLYDSPSVFSDGMTPEVDNYSYQGPVLDLFQTGPITPTTPVDGSTSFFRLPVFGLLHKQ